MKLDSKLFDKIRVRPGPERPVSDDAPTCEWEGCDRTGPHRAPKGRGREGQYFHFCIDHVRDYNKSYNYFAGLPDDAVADFQKDALTGHRPTWTMGVNRAAGRNAPPPDIDAETVVDPFGVFQGARSRYTGGAAAKPARKMLSPLQQKAFDTLGIEEGADKAAIKARYKLLVKRHHPDANGGDRSLEDRLRQIIQAYNYLKSAGFC